VQYEYQGCRLEYGAVMIRYGKGGKTRMVFIGRTTRRAMRAYLRLRHDSSPALFVSKDEERLTYDGLRQLLERRAKRARLSNKPKLHGFRRAFALNMLRSGVDIFVLQRLMGHLICRFCAVTLLRTMRIVNWHICVEAPLTIISEFKLCVELHCDLRFYLPRDYQN
jgi:site-specific recombinase XerC